VHWRWQCADGSAGGRRGIGPRMKTGLRKRVIVLGVLTVPMMLASCAANSPGLSVTGATIGVAGPPVSSLRPPKGVHISLDVRKLSVGGILNVGGSGCNVPAVAFVSVGQPSSYSPSIGGEFEPTAGGEWSGRIVISRSSPVGAHVPVYGVCMESVENNRYWSYPSVDVSISTDWLLTFPKGTVASVGGVLAVTSAVGCPGGVLSGAVIAITKNVGHYFEANSDGHWFGRLSIPKGLTPGAYLLTAACYESREVLAYYQPRVITVRA